MSYDINVLVNGTRCKQYFHNGRVFIEAKEGSEYVIEIKNNTWEKILAVVSVDGLNVIDGNPADEYGPGYVMDRYTSQKLYGFQYSQDKVASFKFGAMGATTIDPKTGEVVPLGYAASKKDGSEKNAGVIGVRIWDEVPKPKPPPPPPNPTTLSMLTCSYAISTSWSITSTFGREASNVNAVYSPDPKNWNAGGLYGTGQLDYSTTTSDIDSNLLKESVTVACAYPPAETKPNMASFDMETQWGSSRSYKVKETTFERREVINSFDIYTPVGKA